MILITFDKTLYMRLLSLFLIGLIFNSCNYSPFDFYQDNVFILTNVKDDANKMEAFVPASFRIEIKESSTEALNQKIVAYPSLETQYPLIEISVMEGIKPNENLNSIGKNLTLNKQAFSYKDSNKPNELICTFQKTKPGKNYFIEIVIKLDHEEGQDPYKKGLCQFESIVKNTRFLD